MHTYVYRVIQRASGRNIYFLIFIFFKIHLVFNAPGLIFFFIYKPYSDMNRPVSLNFDCGLEINLKKRSAQHNIYKWFSLIGIAICMI